MSNAATHTLEVLAGAYKGRSQRAELTHLAYLDFAGCPVAVACKRVDVEHLVDEFGAEDVDARPTCKTCARKWDAAK